jgi:hypothetical protein
MRCWQRLDKKLKDKKFKMEMQTEQICFTAADKMWMGFCFALYVILGFSTVQRAKLSLR